MEENLKYENYSSKTGSIIKKCINKDFRLKRNTHNTCSKCENENKEKDNYCRFCGASLSNIEKINVREEKNKNINPILKQLNLSSIIKTAVSSIAILFIMSIIFKVFVSIGFDDLGNFINPIHIMMGLNLGYVDVSSTNMLGSGSITAHLGLVLLLLGPIISLLLSNVLFMKNKNKSSKDVFLNSLGVGVVYAIIVFILSIISRMRLSFNDMLQYGMAVEASYRPMSVLLNGFIIAFLTTYLLNFKKKYNSENIYLTLLKKAVVIIATGYIVTFVILTGITLTDRSYLYEFGMYSYVDQISIGLILSQLSAYMWGFANFIPVTISNTSISAFSLITSDLFLDTKLIFAVMIALGSLIILLNGCHLKRKYKDSKVNVVLVFSACYAILMGILAIFSSVIIGGNISLLEMNNYQGSVVLGIPVLGAIISSFIYSFALTSIGHKLYVFDDNDIDKNIL
ncbi:hypothetical protein [Romboutsia lituseburensis]|uniref:hypothetical protein n=1 Tax=Romboutsia lituseburensis TaxID=1537 RepID=UPI00215AB412|nr:hypothetical protein [Romboutsia lituseburensis]MCR8747074.1 hypothetical protein [Romboutsia lituseburensis]